MTESPEGTAGQPESHAPREGTSGALPFGADVPRETHGAAPEIPPAAPSQAEAPTPTPVPPPISTPTQPPIAAQPPPIAPPPPPVQRVEEVEAVRITRAETRGPAIEVTGTSRTPEPPPPPAPPPSPATPPGSFRTGVPPPPPPQPPPSAPPPPPSPPPIAPSDPAAAASKKFWVALCHLAYLIPGIPGYPPGLLLAIVIWVWRRRRDSFLDDQAREAINFQLMYAGINVLLTATCILCIFVPVIWMIGAVLCIVATVNAADGKRYRYPWLFRLIT